MRVDRVLWQTHSEGVPFERQRLLDRERERARLMLEGWPNGRGRCASSSPTGQSEWVEEVVGGRQPLLFSTPWSSLSPWEGERGWGGQATRGIEEEVDPWW